MNRVFVTLVFPVLICLIVSKLSHCQEAHDVPRLECVARSLERWSDCQQLQRDLVNEINNTKDSEKFALLKNSLERCRSASALSLRIGACSASMETPSDGLRILLENEVEHGLDLASNLAGAKNNFLNKYSFLGLKSRDISKEEFSWVNMEGLLPSRKWIESQRQDMRTSSPRAEKGKRNGNRAKAR